MIYCYFTKKYNNDNNNMKTPDTTISYVGGFPQSKPASRIITLKISPFWRRPRVRPLMTELYRIKRYYSIPISGTRRKSVGMLLLWPGLPRQILQLLLSRGMPKSVKTKMKNLNRNLQNLFWRLVARAPTKTNLIRTTGSHWLI